MNLGLTRREFVMAATTCIAAVAIGECKLIELAMNIAESKPDESDEDDEDPI